MPKPAGSVPRRARHDKRLEPRWDRGDRSALLRCPVRRSSSCSSVSRCLLATAEVKKNAETRIHMLPWAAREIDRKQAEEQRRQRRRQRGQPLPLARQHPQSERLSAKVKDSEEVPHGEPRLTMRCHAMHRITCFRSRVQDPIKALLKSVTIPMPGAPTQHVSIPAFNASPGTLRAGTSSRSLATSKVRGRGSFSSASLPTASAAQPGEHGHLHTATSAR
jgi:hypothetical protein